MPAISTSVTELTGNLPAYYENLINYINDLPEDSIISKDTIMDTINNIKNIDFASYFSTERIIEYVKGMVSVAQGVFSVFVTIIMSIYILLQRDSAISSALLTLVSNFISKMQCTLWDFHDG